MVDDQFGALSLGLSALSPTVVADSAVLPAALAHNASLNPEVTPPESVFSWINAPEGPFDLVVLRIPRQADYLAWLLRWLNRVMADSGVLLAGGMIKHLPARSVDVFAEAVRTEQVLPARKKARVIRCNRGAANLADWSATWKGYRLGDRKGDVGIEALPAVFAREKLDIGTRLMLPHVAKEVSTARAGDSVLDLACGNGVLAWRRCQSDGVCSWFSAMFQARPCSVPVVMLKKPFRMPKPLSPIAMVLSPIWEPLI